MRMLAVTAVIGTSLVAIPASQSQNLGSLEREFAAGGRISMDLSAGEYEITGSPDGRIRLDWSVEDQSRLDEVRARVDVRDAEASVSTDGPRNNFEVRLQVPARSNLRVRLTAGELTISGIEGDKDVVLHAGELDIDVIRAEDYQQVSAGVWAGQLHASPFRVMKEGLFRSFDWKGEGPYRLNVHLKAGELRLHADSVRK